MNVIMKLLAELREDPMLLRKACWRAFDAAITLAAMLAFMLVAFGLMGDTPIR